jgi:hypothetical protein
MLLHQINKLLMVDCSSTDYNNIFSKVVSTMEINNHLSVDLPYVIDITQNWLPHHMLSVNVEVNILHQSFFGILIDRFQFLPNRVFLHLEMIVV